ncbi:hypothetical protein KUCAC02_001483, partial [Chaenocephalus aceratus]
KQFLSPTKAESSPKKNNQKDLVDAGMQARLGRPSSKNVCVSRLLLSGSSLSFLYLADTVTVTDFRRR